MTTTTHNPRNLEVVFFGLNGYAVVEPGEGLALPPGFGTGRVVSRQYRTEAEAEADLAERLAFDDGLRLGRAEAERYLTAYDNGLADATDTGDLLCVQRDAYGRQAVLAATAPGVRCSGEHSSNEAALAECATCQHLAQQAAQHWLGRAQAMAEALDWGHDHHHHPHHP